MPGGLFPRLKNWADLENLTNEDLNAEFDNIIQNLLPGQFDDYSVNVAQMQAQTSPGDVGTESLATSMSAELERIRFVLARITGKTFWYQAPDRSLASENLSDQVAFYLPFEGEDPTAQSAVNSLVSRGAILNAVTQSSLDFVAGDLSAVEKKFSNFGMILGAGNFLAYPSKYNARNLGTIGAHFKGLLPGDYIAYNPLLGLELYLDGAGFLTAKMRKATAASQTAKEVATVAGTVSRAAGAAFTHAAVRYKLNGVSGVGADVLNLMYNGADEGVQLDATTIANNDSGEGMWFFGAKKNDPTWDKFSAMAVIPSLEAADAWTASGAAGNATVSSGVLTINTANPSVSTVSFNKSNNVNLSGMTVECKFKFDVTSVNYGSNVNGEPVFIKIRDDSMDRSVKIALYPDHIAIQQARNNPIYLDFFPCNLLEWNHLRFTFNGGVNPSVSVYINGKLEGTSMLAFPDADAGDVIEFGHGSAGTTLIKTYWEHFAYHGSGGVATAPVTHSSLGFLDDIICTNSELSDATILNLVSSSGKSMFNTEALKGVTAPKEFHMGYLTATGDFDTASVSMVKVAPDAALTNHGDYLYYVSDGKTQIEIEAEGVTYVSGAGVAGTVMINLNDSAVGLTAGNFVYPVGHRFFDSIKDGFPITRKILLPAGLHKIGLLLGNYFLAAGTVSVQNVLLRVNALK